jgi:hypothetical protein
MSTVVIDIPEENEPVADPGPSPTVVVAASPPEYAWELLDIYPPVEVIAKALQDKKGEKKR